jgi:hypothetical protein
MQCHAGRDVGSHTGRSQSDDRRLHGGRSGRSEVLASAAGDQRRGCGAAVKKKGEVSFILGNPKVDDAELTEFLAGTEGIIEDSSSLATSYIYEKVTERDGRDAYKQHGMGLMHTVGEVGDMPVCVSLTYNHIRGHKILFVEATSAVVDHRMVREWIEQVACHSRPTMNMVA